MNWGNIWAYSGRGRFIMCTVTRMKSTTYNGSLGSRASHSVQKRVSMTGPELPGHRTQEEVLKSAAGIDQLIRAGVDKTVIMYTLQARKAWRGKRDWPPLTTLMHVVAEPRIQEFDELLYAAVRKRVRDLTQ